VKRIKQAAAKVMIAGTLSVTVVVGTAGIASAVGSGGYTTGTGGTASAAYYQAQSLCDSRQISQVVDTWESGGLHFITAICA
jgi:hypothetical protein